MSFLGFDKYAAEPGSRSYEYQDFAAVYTAASVRTRLSFHYSTTFVLVTWSCPDFSDLRIVGVTRTGGVGGVTSPKGYLRSMPPERRDAIGKLGLTDLLAWIDAE
jgi:hypothetical protein